MIPAAAVLIRTTSLTIVMIFFVVEFLNLVKCISGMILVHKGVWVRNIAVYEE